MTGAKHEADGEIIQMMQCSDKMTARLPIDINRTSNKLVLTKY
jgi:hypothetical protein